MDRFWERAAAKGKDANPYRAAFLQLVGVAETDAQAEERVRRARRVLLQEAPARAAAVPRAARLQRLQEPARTSSQPNRFEFADLASTSSR